MQISAKHAVGGAGGLLTDEDTFDSPADLANLLSRLAVPQQVIQVALASLAVESAVWVPVATELQIPFDTLVKNGFSLEDED